MRESRAGSWAILAVAAGVHLAFWGSLVGGFHDPLFNDATHRLPRGLDFYAVYQKSHEFAEGKSLHTRIGAYHLWKITPVIVLFLWLPRLLRPDPREYEEAIDDPTSDEPQRRSGPDPCHKIRRGHPSLLVMPGSKR